MKLCLAVLALLLATCSAQFNFLKNFLLRLKVPAMEREAAQLLRSNARLIPGWVRLSFHDCVGGCDGCVDLKNRENAGLEPFLNGAKDFQSKHAKEFSLADVIAFLGIQALEAGAQRAGGRMNIRFRPGRKDCDSSKGFPKRDIPGGNRLDSVQFLKNEFSLSDREAVALLGCHSLGRTHTEFSGFNGPWDATVVELDNGYFQNMVAPGWQHDQRDNNNAKSTQWSKNSQQFMMLHADMIMFKKFSTSGPFDTPSCTFDTCPAGDNARDVSRFAGNQRDFHRQIARAFLKMIEH